MTAYLPCASPKCSGRRKSFSFGMVKCGEDSVLLSVESISGLARQVICIFLGQPYADFVEGTASKQCFSPLFINVRAIGPVQAWHRISRGAANCNTSSPPPCCTASFRSVRRYFSSFFALTPCMICPSNALSAGFRLSRPRLSLPQHFVSAEYD